MTWGISLTIALLVTWLAWPRAVRYLWRRRRITPTGATALVIARAPVVIGIGALLFGASPLVALFVVLLMTLASGAFFKYLREVLSDPPAT